MAAPHALFRTGFKTCVSWHLAFHQLYYGVTGDYHANSTGTGTIIAWPYAWTWVRNSVKLNLYNIWACFQYHTNHVAHVVTLIQAQGLLCHFHSERSVPVDEKLGHPGACKFCFVRRKERVERRKGIYWFIASLNSLHEQDACWFTALN